MMSQAPTAPMAMKDDWAMAKFGDKAKRLVEIYCQSWWQPALFSFGLGAILCLNAYFIRDQIAQNFAFWCAGTCFGYGLFQLLFPLKRAEFSELERARMEAQLREMFLAQFEMAKRDGLIPPDATANFGWKQ